MNLWLEEDLIMEEPEIKSDKTCLLNRLKLNLLKFRIVGASKLQILSIDLFKENPKTDLDFKEYNKLRIIHGLEL